jgi:phosphoribosyl 1,2-cyclic phosphodiesterase
VIEYLGFTGHARLDSLVVPFDDQPFEPVPGVTARALRVAHDRTGSHAFVFAADGHSIGCATDLGMVPEALIRHFCGIDILAIESNYDPQMQAASGRPVFLQNRITGGAGHLSNAQALSAVSAVFDRCQRHRQTLPGQVVLLHRSRQCNCPVLLNRLFSVDPRWAGRVTLTEQFTATPWIKPAQRPPLRGEQLMLFGVA